MFQSQSIYTLDQHMFIQIPCLDSLCFLKSNITDHAFLGGHWKHFVKRPKVSIWRTKFSMLAHPPKPKPTTKTHTTTKIFIEYKPAHPPRNFGGLSTAFCDKSLQLNFLFSNKTIIPRKIIMIIQLNFVPHINSLNIYVVQRHEQCHDNN